MIKLIVNADDFGLHKEINEAIIQGHAAGCITSTSLMAVGAAFDEAVKRSLSVPSLGIGAHLTLVAEMPLLPPDRVRSLVDENGRFFPDYLQFIRRYMRNEINHEEIYAELAAQVERILDAGISITHLDSHQHLHVLPRITDMCLVLAEKYGIKAMRIPSEPYLFTGGYPLSPMRFAGRCGLTFLSWQARRKAKKQMVAVPDYFFGMLAGGHLQEAYLKNILLSLPEAVSEIMIHPGKNADMLRLSFPWGYQWEEELNAAVSPSVMELIQGKNIRLSSFGEL